MKDTSFAAAGIPLRNVLAIENRGACPPNLCAASCTSDWRELEPGDVYFAITGEDDDGHDHAAAAVSRGALAVVCERPLPIFGVPQCVVADSRVVYGRLCQALVGNPSLQLKVIAVAGAHGKTSVARLLSAILREAGLAVGTLDSFGYWDGYEERPRSGDTLSPPALALALANMVAAGATHAVVEVSSLDLARHTLAGVSLDAVCLTEVGRRHIDRHGSVENYVSAQRRVLDFLHPDAVAVLNADDPASMRILADLARPALTYGMKKPCEISAQVIEQFVNEQTFLLSAGDDSVGVRTQIVGDHHVYNCLAAATTALAYGVELTAIARGLESVDVLPGRMERVVCGQDFAVLVDAANTPDALRHCLRTARQVTSGRLICVFGATLDCDPSELPAIGRVIGSYADAAVVTNGGPADAGSHRTCLEIRSGFAHLDKVQVVLDRREAIRGALREAQAGDTIVLAGLGDRPHTPIASEMLASDSELVKEVLRAPAVTLPFRLAA